MSENKYLISIDLDGTLLRDDKTISEQTIKYLKELENRGHLVVLTTGRPFRSANVFRNLIGLTSPIICYNGAFIRAENENYSHYRKIPHQISHKLYDLLLNKYCSNFILENEDEVFTCFKDTYLEYFFPMKEMKLHVGKIPEILKEDTFSCILKISEHTEQEKEEIQNILNQIPEVKLRYWFKEDYAEIYLSDVSKANSVRYVANEFGIDEDHIITFGDANNDIELLRDFKNSYVMKNGIEELRAVAKNVTKNTNEDDGVYYALKEFFKD